MQASILTATGHPTANFQLGTIDRPKISSPDEVLIKVAYAAVNPVDYKMAQHNFFISTLPIVLGCDVSGTVVEIGENVKNVKVGDKVFGFTKIGTPGHGSFAEYIVHEADFAIKVPASWSLAQAASAPVGLLTAGIGLFHDIGLPAPSKAAGAKKEDDFILVWGGSTSVGHYVIQLAVQAGYRVIATASAANAENVRALGAEFVVDYRDEAAVSKIIEHTHGRLRFAFDNIGSATANLCVEALKHENSILATIAGVPSISPLPSHVTVKNVFLGGAYLTPEGAEFLKNFINNEVVPLLDAGRLHAQPLKIFEGLENVPIVLEQVKDNKLGGAKGIIRIAGDE